MNTDTGNDPFPFRSPLTSIPPLILTVLVSILVSLQKAGPTKHLNELINNRGPIPYMLIFCAFAAVIPIVLLNWKPRPVSGLWKATMLGLILMPTLLGLTGTLQGLGYAWLDHSRVLQAGLSEADAVAAQSRLFAGQAAALDVLFLGLIYTIMLLFPFASLLQKLNRTVQPAGGAYFLPGAGKKSAHP